MLKLISILVPISITVLLAACENASAYQIQKSKAEDNKNKKKQEDINQFLNI